MFYPAASGVGVGVGVGAGAGAGAGAGSGLDTDLFDCLVLASGQRPTMLRNGKGTGFKAGIHMVFQNLFVTLEMALQMVSSVIARAEEKWPAPDNAWRKRFDEGVYGPGRGLRWAWQFKAKPCEGCLIIAPESGKATPNRRGCNLCQEGVVADTRASMYSPVYFVSPCKGGGVAREPIPTACRFAPTVDLLMCASIRKESEGPTPGYEVYPGAPPAPVLKVGRGRGAGVTVVVPGAVKRGAGDLVPEGSSAHRCILAAVRRHHIRYAHLGIHAVYRLPSGFMYRVAIRSFGGCYCQNVGKDHLKAAVKFIVTQKGVHQECMCKCDTVQGRKGGVRCRDYSSPKTPLLDSERRVLFGDVDGGDGKGRTAVVTMDSFDAFAEEMYQRSKAMEMGDSVGSVSSATKQIHHRMMTGPLPSGLADRSPEEREEGVTSKWTARREACDTLVKNSLLQCVKAGVKGPGLGSGPSPAGGLSLH